MKATMKRPLVLLFVISVSVIALSHMSLKSIRQQYSLLNGGEVTELLALVYHNATTSRLGKTPSDWDFLQATMGNAIDRKLAHDYTGGRAVYDASIESEEVSNDDGGELSDDERQSLAGGQPAATPKKLQLVISIGPPKTATTSLQVSLTAFEDEGILAKDKYVFVGRLLRPTETNGELALNRDTTPVVEAVRDRTTHVRCTSNPRTLCWAQVARELRPYKQRGQNVLMCDESFGLWFKDEDYQAMKEALQDEWDITIAAGYRRFYEWLPSAKFQRERIDYGWHPHKMLWPGVELGLEYTPLLPQFFDDWRKTQRWKHSAYMADVAQQNINVRFYNLHDTQKSVRSSFLCDVIPNAPKACQSSRQRDKYEEVYLNSKGDLIRTPFFDAIATAAERQGLINATAWPRHTVRTAVKYFHTQVLNLTLNDFPLKCPSSEDLERYLQYSLELEQKCFPSSFSTMVQAHQEGFEEKVGVGAFCWIDTTPILQRRDWLEFLSQFSGPASENERRKWALTGRSAPRSR